MRIRKRLSADLEAAKRLLRDAGLPLDGLEATEGWVSEAEGQVVGHIAIEPTLDAVVIRSLVVDPSQRGKGLGEDLMKAAEAGAGDRKIVLKTETIGPWMERRGYRRATLAEVPASVRGTTQFAGTLCSGTPVYLKEDAPMNHHLEKENIKSAVRERYAGFVKQRTSCCGTAKSCGCSGALEDPSLRVGYAIQDIEAVPDGANLGLGCGNPVALASIKPGETVLDLGSGAGFDAFLAAKRVGSEGRVIGVDMTPEMIARARDLAQKHGYANVEFRQGDIEQLPVEDATVDAIISNCVINLTTDKAQTFREAFRVLKPGGRVMVSDIVLVNPLPASILKDMDAYAACVAGALRKEDYLEAIRQAGFSDITIEKETHFISEDPSPAEVESAQKRNPEITLEDLKAAGNAGVSIQVRATRPLVATPGKDCCQGCCPSA